MSDRKVHKLAKKWQYVCIFLLCKKTMYQNFGKILDRSKNSVNYKSRPILDESGSLRKAGFIANSRHCTIEISRN